MKNNVEFFYPFIGAVLFILFWSIFYFFFGEKISVNNGCGYDGAFYCTITQNFEFFLREKSFALYYVNRILPCGIVYCVLNLLNAPVSVPNIIVGFYILNTISWIAFLFVWYKILTYYRISSSIQWFMSILILVNFYVLKFIFYYPVLTDSIAFFFGTVLLWFYIKNRTIPLLITGFLGAFVYPLFIFYTVVLLIFPVHVKLADTQKQVKNRTDYFILAALLIGFAIIRTLFAYRIHYSISTGFHLNTLLYIVSYGYVLYHFLPSWQQIKANIPELYGHFIRKKTFYRIGIGIVLLLITSSIKVYLSQNSMIENPKQVYMAKSLLGVGFHGLAWAVEFFSGFGMIAVLLIIQLKKIFETSFEYSVGLYGIMLLNIALMLRIEARTMIDIYVFMLFILSLSLQKQHFSFRTKHIIVIAIINFLLSKCFLSIEKSSKIWSEVENRWVSKNYALSTYLMNDVQYFVLLALFCLCIWIVFQVLQKLKQKSISE